MAVTSTPRTVPVSKALVRQKAVRLLKTDAQVLVLRTRPEWRHGDLEIDGQRVQVLEGISQLAILDAYDRLKPTDRLIVLTDRPREDLGDSVLVRALKQDIDLPDEWATVPDLFPGAHEVSDDLRRRNWAATALLDHAPTGGWPRSPGPAVTAGHAIGSLLAHLLHQESKEDLDAVLLLTVLGRREVRTAWARVEPILRGDLIDWALDEIGPAAAFALQVAQRQEHVTPLAVALALDVLWPEDESAPVEAQTAARARVERYVNGRTIPVQEAKTTARLARTAVLRMSLEATWEPDLAVALRQAEALLADLGWPAGAERSSVLHAGLTARLAALGEALDARRGFDETLAEVRAHREGKDLEAPGMAVRLARWLATDETPTRDLAGDLQRQMDDGAWVDVALGVVWSGADSPSVSAAYRRLIDDVRERRRARDELAADRLAGVSPAEMASPDSVGEIAFGVEAVLRGVLSPWRDLRPAVGADKSKGRMLFVVLDGMSAAIASQLAGEVTRAGLAEWVPSGTQRRLGVAAALPSLTAVSRASLFAGAVRVGDAKSEAKDLASAFPGSKVFHKDDLRAEGGAALPDAVTDAVANARVPVVGVVINAIDDAIHKNDTSGSGWDMARLAPLNQLLDAAWRAKRAVVITSDHGHVVERDSDMLSLPPGAESRWRPASSGPAGEGEVLAVGARVAEPPEGAVLLWRDDARYGRRNAGYHGGAALAEITVPVLVFQDVTTESGPPGWAPAPPQVPAWWNDPVAEKALEAPKRKSKASRKKATPAGEQDAVLFDVVWTEPDVVVEEPRGMVEAVLGSETFRAQKAMAGSRRAPADAVVGAVLKALLDREGRAHRDTVAAAAGIPAAQIVPTLAVVRRVLNVDGYPILELDSDGVTLKVDSALLSEQFGIGD